MDKRTRHHACLLLLIVGAGTWITTAGAQQQPQPAPESQIRLHVQVPPSEAPDAEQCPDRGSFVVVGPTVRRGEPITAQAWSDCADLPRRGASQQPMIGVEIPLTPAQGRPGRQLR
jgi:hypothetical protein